MNTNCKINFISLFCFIFLFTFCREAEAVIRYVKLGNAGSAPYTSWATAGGDLQQVINFASTGDSIWVAAGVYTPPLGQSFSMKEGVKIYGGFVGNETELNQRDWNLNVAFLQGNGTRVIANNNNSLSGDARLDGFTIRNGNTSTGGGIYNYKASPTIINILFTGNNADYGGAIYNTSSHPTIEDCIFNANTASSGGGIYNLVSEPMITNCLFTLNLVDTEGAGIYNDDAAPVIAGCSFTSNKAESGAGMYNFFDSAPIVSDCSFNDNDAAYGGGMYNYSATPTISKCTFTADSTTSNGGAMYNFDANPVIDSCIFNANVSKAYGGGIYNYQSDPQITNGVFSGNIASFSGGGLYNNTSSPDVDSTFFNGNIANTGGAIHNNSNSSPQIENCTFSKNNATSYGGAISNSNSSPTIINSLFLANTAVTYAGGIYNSSSPAKLTNCTLFGNSAGYGGAIRNSSSSPIIQNSIIYGNSSGLYDANSSPTIAYSLIQGLHSTLNGNIDGDVNPRFVDSNDPDGADDIPGNADDGLALQSCSPCVDKGNNAYIVLYPRDLIRNDRIFNNQQVDLGAYEVQIPSFHPQLILTQDPVSSCSGEMVTISANYQAGTHPFFHWYLNDTLVQSDTIAHYQSNALNDGDKIIVSVIFDECTFPYTDTILASIIPTPDVFSSPAVQDVCSGSLIAPIILNGNVSGASYQWTRDMPQITGISMSGSGNISGSLINNGNTAVTVTFIITPSYEACVGTPDTAMVTVYPLPVATATATPNPVCEGELVWFMASGGVGFKWSGPNDFSFEGAYFGRHVDLTMAGIYTVTVSSSAGCTSTASVTVSVSPAPVPTISISPNPACTGNTVQLFATGGSGYQWSGPNGFTSNLQSPQLLNIKQNQSGTYTVTVTNENGCTALVSAQLKVNPTPVGKVWFDEKTTCAGNTLQLYASGGGTYQWSGPDGFSSTKQNPTRPNVNIGQSGIYTVVITGLYGGCSVSYSINVVIHPLPSVTAWTTTPELCEGDVAYLFANGASSYNWTGPYGYQSNIQNPIIFNIPSFMEGIYTVKGTSVYGCTATASLFIDVQSVNAVIDATPNPVPYGGTLYLTASGGETYQWIGPNGFYTNQQNPIIYKFTQVNAGLYVCIVSSKAGCQDSEIILVQVKFQNAQDESQLDTRTGKYVQVYPNPASEVIKLDSDFSGQMDYTILNTQGEVVKKGKTSNGDQVPITDLTSGSYYIQWTYTVDDKKQSNISKFIKAD